MVFSSNFPLINPRTFVPKDVTPNAWSIDLTTTNWLIGIVAKNKSQIETLVLYFYKFASLFVTTAGCCLMEIDLVAAQLF